MKASSPDSHCDPAGPDTRLAYQRVQAKRFAGSGSGAVRGNNCFHNQGQNVSDYITIGQGACTAGTPIYLHRAAVECANVFSDNDGDTSGSCPPGQGIRTLDQTSEWSGHCVEWRYVTKDRRWVRVEDLHADARRAHWMFIALSSLDPDRTKWHAYATKTCSLTG